MVKGLYLSKDALIKLKVIPPNFPGQRPAKAVGNDDAAVATVRMTSNHAKTMQCKCDGKNKCVQREKPSEVQIKEPTFKLNEENRAALKKHLIEQFASSTFNKCENQELPTMTCKPIKITVKKDANPVFQRGGTVPASTETSARRH